MSENQDDSGKVYIMPAEHKKDLEDKNKSSFGSFVLELIKIVVICLAIIIPVRFFLIQPFFVRGDSMEPNFSDREYLIIDEISYRFSEPERGDVIVFRYPKDPSQYYIKRIIGLPGETLEIDDGRVIVLNEDHKKGVEVKEFYLPDDFDTPGDSKIELGAEEYFVLGDNRRASSDSRVWGALPQNYIVGKVWLRALPVNKAQAFQAPEYKALDN
ncbi:signal peptidase I [Patescibacteria group bacterium]|nr:signal peptidase I [Patescibacteria group bacterium]